MQSQRRAVDFFMHPLFVSLISLIVFVIGMVIISAFVMNLPGSTIEQLIIVMLATGILFTLLSYGVYQSGVLQHLGSLRWLLLMIVFFTVGVVMLNLWLLSRIMFFDTHYLPIVTTMLFFAGLTAVSFGYFVSRAMTVRLFKLSDAADKLAQGDLSTRLDVRGNDEIAHLIRSFNTMARELQEVDVQKRRLEKTRRDLVAWVSHDLRTPLTSMRVMLEALADGVITDEETRSRYIKTTLSEIEHLSRLIQDLFEMAQLDVGHVELDYAQTPIADLLSDTLGGLRPKAQEKNIDLSGHVEDGIDLIQVAPDKIQRVLKNLIDNAIKYTPENESVRVTVHRKDNQYIQIDVHNTGVYIEANVLPHLFESFYRGEKSRANPDDERGTGLGLAIARGFIQAHGGQIRAESNPADGTTFSFTLPGFQETKG